jgi:[ribosomal protein S5]-alanine N-acetyltransferase
MLIRTNRFTLRDFREEDRAAFVSYQMDPRYRGLYDAGEGEGDAQALFDLFLAWRQVSPRENYQFGIFEAEAGRLCGCAGLRMAGAPPGAAVLGIELTPDDWGRYRLAIEVADALLEFGFSTLGLSSVVGDTASGNRRVEKLARWFGAEITDRRPGPGWMVARGWHSVDWMIDRQGWNRSRARLRRFEAP